MGTAQKERINYDFRVRLRRFRVSGSGDTESREDHAHSGRVHVFHERLGERGVIRVGFRVGTEDFGQLVKTRRPQAFVRGHKIFRKHLNFIHKKNIAFHEWFPLEFDALGLEHLRGQTESIAANLAKEDGVVVERVETELLLHVFLHHVLLVRFHRFQNRSADAAALHRTMRLRVKFERATLPHRFDHKVRAFAILELRVDVIGKIVDRGRGYRRTVGARKNQGSRAGQLRVNLGTVFFHTRREDVIVHHVAANTRVGFNLGETLTDRRQELLDVRDALLQIALVGDHLVHLLLKRLLLLLVHLAGLLETA